MIKYWLKDSWREENIYPDRRSISLAYWIILASQNCRSSVSSQSLKRRLVVISPGRKILRSERKAVNLKFLNAN